MLQVALQARRIRNDIRHNMDTIVTDYNGNSQDDTDDIIIDWSEGDRHNPQQWSLTKKWAVTMEIAMIALVVGMAGSINSGADEYAAERFGVSLEVMSLQTGLFLVGFGVSAPIMGPLSELKGRNPVYIVTLLIFSGFCLGSGFAQNIQTRVILRFFAGCFGSSPLSNAGGSVADMADHRQRTYLFPVFSFAGFAGPALGPVLGGWIGERAGQQWCDWVTAAAGFGLSFFLILLMPETLGAELLRYRAKALREFSGNQRFMTKLEQRMRDSGESFLVHVRRSTIMPIMFLLTEPITLCFSLYLTVVYIILFGDLESFPLLFGIYNWDAGKTGSVFASIFLGMALTGLLTWPSYRYYQYVLSKTPKGRMPDPEQRLWFGGIGTWFMPISLFWAGWTAYPSISPWSMIVSQFFFGIGSLSCFISSYMYIIDVYQVNCASPLATLTFLRYNVSGGGAVMFTRPMFRGIGNHWAMSLLGFLSIAVSLIPIVFYIFGPRIRARSRYAMAQ